MINLIYSRKLYTAYYQRIAVQKNCYTLQAPIACYNKPYTAGPAVYDLPLVSRSDVSVSIELLQIGLKRQAF